MQIKKSFSTKVSDKDLEPSGTTMFCSWERLYPYLNDIANIKPNEKIRGVVVDEDGIKFLIENK